MAVNMELKLNKKAFVDKTKTRLWEVEKLFVNEQKARQNSPYTIAHYERSFKRMCEFLAFECASGPDEVEKMFNEERPANEKSPLFFYGKNLPLMMLEMDDIQRLYVSYLTDICHVSQQTVASYLRDFKALYTFCSIDNEWIKPLKIVIKQPATPIKNTYSDAELKKLLVKPDINNFTEYRDWVIVNYLLSTGNRVQTIINLKVGDIDTEEGYVDIRVQKSGKITRIPLVKKMCKILDEYIANYREDEDDWLFCNRFGEQLSAGGLKKSIAAYNVRHNVNKTSIHLYRHTFAKEWIISGGSTASLQKMLGHSTMRAVQQYLNLYGTELTPLAEEHAVINKQKTHSGKTLKRKTLQRVKVLKMGQPICQYIDVKRKHYLIERGTYPMKENFDIYNIQQKAENLVNAYNEMCRIQQMLEDNIDIPELNEMYFDNDLQEEIPMTVAALCNKLYDWNMKAAEAYSKATK